jgi:hypothetical protein
MISATLVPPSLPRFAAAPAAATGPAEVRPNVEWWEVGDQRYDSTCDLLAKFKPSGSSSTPALYHWRQETQFGKAEKLAAVKRGALNGAGAGALLGGVLAVGMNVLGFVGTVLTGGFFGIFGGVGLLGPIVGGAALGALIGAISGPADAKARFESGTIVEGQLQPEVQADGSRHLEFYVDGQVKDKVDLDSYAKAQPGPLPQGAEPWWSRAGQVPIND